MKKFILFTVLAGVMPLTLLAQDDDLYFTPKKTVETTTLREHKTQERSAYYCGSNRDVDEYNRHGNFRSYYQKIGTDSVGNDIIEFHVGDGNYPDSLAEETPYVRSNSNQYYNGYDDDYLYCRRMGYFDGFYGWYNPYFYSYWGYGPYWNVGWGWYDPWYYGYYNPWYYDSWYGWGYPYYGYGWGGYYNHNYAWTGGTGTRNHGFVNPRAGENDGKYYSGNFSGYRGHSANSTRVDGRFGSSSYSNSRSGNFTGARYSNRGTYQSTNQSRSYNYNSNSSSRSYSSGSFSSGGSSFGGGRSGGGFSGGGHSGGGGGGGHFGGRR
jgi:hypothetical protein